MSKKLSVPGVDVSWKDITPGGIVEAGTCREFKTGDWRSVKPVWKQDACKQCLLCFPVCPDSSIPINKDGKREDFDYDYCKGCGVCANVCPFHAIDMVDED